MYIEELGISGGKWIVCKSQ